MSKTQENGVDHSREEALRNSTLSRSEESLQVIYKGLGYEITLPTPGKVRKTILTNVSGIFRPGRITAIMGNSGAGKTSFLNVLAGNIHDTRTSNVQGTVQINGEKIVPSFMKRLSGFVFQDDLILDTMTVREAITMSAILRLPEIIPLSDKLARVEDIIKILRLEKAADTIVGNDRVKGISGGERKRTSMAMEMVINPSILFLDEPTSGLDTFTAYSVITTLKDLAKQGRTVVATIHQPSSDIFMLMDDLLLLSEGKVVYYGEASRVVDYFAKRGYPCPKYVNPSDYIFMHILNNSEELEGRFQSEIEKQKTKGTSKERIEALINDWQLSEENIALEKEISNPLSGGVNSVTAKAISPFKVQFNYLTGRALKNALRNKLLVRVRYAQSIFLGVLMGLIYLNIPNRQYSAQVQDRSGLLFFVCLNNFMGSTMGIISNFGAEKRVFLREFGAGYYGLASYFFSKIMVEFPFFLSAPILLVIAVYFMSGLQLDAAKFFIHAGIVSLVAATGTSLGLFFGSVFANLFVALAVGPMVILPLMVFSGFLLNNENIPVYFDWIKYISPIKYAYSSLMQNELRSLTFNNCGPANSANCKGETVLENMGLSNDIGIGANLGILAVFTVGLLALSYASLFRAIKKI